jgi:predicted Zn-dependent peptidase
MKHIQRTLLDNGLVVASERMDHVRSVSFGIFLRTGSRHETLNRHGLTHFIEHALFKGTRRRSAAEIAAESDTLGGHLDAFTGREMVGFFNKVLDQHMPQALELIADLVTAPAFERTEIDKERNVILEEIKMVEDTPDDLVFEIFSENFYPNHPLGRPILGTPDRLATFKRERVRGYYGRIYRPGNLVLAAAGRVDHRELVRLARRYFGSLPAAEGSGVPAFRAPRPTPHVTLRHKKELEQSHLVIGAPCPSLVSESRYTAHLMTTVLGGGMSSRLFQAIREDRGLVYTVFSTTTAFQDSGYLSIYAGASTEQLTETIKATMAELRRLKTELISDQELERNKEQLKASLMLNLDSTTSRMSAIAQQEMFFHRFISPDEIIRRVDAVSAEDVRRLAKAVFVPSSLAVTVLGNLDGFKLDRSQLEC